MALCETSNSKINFSAGFSLLHLGSSDVEILAQFLKADSDQSSTAMVYFDAGYTSIFMNWRASYSGIIKQISRDSPLIRDFNKQDNFSISTQLNEIC